MRAAPLLAALVLLPDAAIAATPVGTLIEVTSEQRDYSASPSNGWDEFAAACLR